jgi:hypothetical protein
MGRYSVLWKQVADFPMDMEIGRERVEAAIPAAQAKRQLFAQEQSFSRARTEQLRGSPANSEYSNQIVQRPYPCAVVEDGRVQIHLRPAEVVAQQAFEDLARVDCRHQIPVLKQGR